MPAFALFALFAAAAAPSQADSVIGQWSNPKGTVIVRTSRCGDAICGTVVKAAPSAQDAARAAGTTRLVGTRILNGFRPAGAGIWQGEAFVPDKGLTVPATMTRIGRDSLQIEGCSFGGYLCRQQIWHRVATGRRRG
jgi:uncharacterized protein (DUF2147 family)